MSEYTIWSNVSEQDWVGSKEINISINDSNALTLLAESKDSNLPIVLYGFKSAWKVKDRSYYVEAAKLAESIFSYRKELRLPCVSIDYPFALKFTD